MLFERETGTLVLASRFFLCVEIFIGKEKKEEHYEIFSPISDKVGT